MRCSSRPVPQASSAPPLRRPSSSRTATRPTPTAATATTPTPTSSMSTSTARRLSTSSRASSPHKVLVWMLEKPRKTCGRVLRCIYLNRRNEMCTYLEQWHLCSYKYCVPTVRLIIFTSSAVVWMLRVVRYSGI